MHLVSFCKAGAPRIGVLDTTTDEIVDLSRAAAALPAGMTDFIAAGDAALAEANRAVASGTGRLRRTAVALLAPLPQPRRNIICVGKNYRDHLKEVNSIGAGGEAPALPIFFTKATSCVIGPAAAIPAHLDPTGTTDYEGELAVVIGRGGRGIDRANAMQHVYGYTIVNDVTSRKLQADHQQWFLGKSLDGFCPMGPAIVTVDTIADPTRLRIETWVNGEPRQNGGVDQLIFDIPTLIETLSAFMTLQPGDVIATGTPAGVGMGFNPPRYLRPGDVVRMRIEPIGVLENPVV